MAHTGILMRWFWQLPSIPPNKDPMMMTCYAARSDSPYYLMKIPHIAQMPGFHLMFQSFFYVDSPWVVSM